MRVKGEVKSGGELRERRCVEVVRESRVEIAPCSCAKTEKEEGSEEVRKKKKERKGRKASRAPQLGTTLRSQGRLHSLARTEPSRIAQIANLSSCTSRSLEKSLGKRQLVYSDPLSPLCLLDLNLNRILPLQHLKRDRDLKLTQPLHPTLLNALLLHKCQLRRLNMHVALTEEGEDVRGRDGTEEVGGSRGSGEALEEEGLGKGGEGVDEGGFGGAGGGVGVELRMMRG